jgi:hypothetical protein
MFDQTLDRLGVGYEDESKKRRTITFHSFRRNVKTIISDLGFSDFSEFVLGHSSVLTYYRGSDKEHYKLFKNKIEPSLTFLDQSYIESKHADIVSKLETMEEENIRLKTKYETQLQQINEKLKRMDKVFQGLGS